MVKKRKLVDHAGMLLNLGRDIVAIFAVPNHGFPEFDIFRTVKSHVLENELQTMKPCSSIVTQHPPGILVNSSAL